ncbi:exonuclease domain-containing protein [Tellurirhabdus bombi]|uniref:exonuclease domain-containing protein n=1 Tax=Tellurirhabdus bombi TaxID=2907205 RepID=UPI001F28BDDC|nr:exonuclease domain-containing protein [Tellurirhabdus bombi]
MNPEEFELLEPSKKKADKQYTDLELLFLGPRCDYDPVNPRTPTGRTWAELEAYRVENLRKNFRLGLTGETTLPEYPSSHTMIEGDELEVVLRAMKKQEKRIAKKYEYKSHFLTLIRHHKPFVYFSEYLAQLEAEAAEPVLLEVPGLDFIAIDFETANSKRNSACSLGWVDVRSGRVYDKGYHLIKPFELEFDYMAVKKHGITLDMVKNERTFDVLWREELQARFEGKLIIAHNAASFDMNVLRSTLEAFGVTVPNLRYGCTMQAARELKMPGKLKELCVDFQIKLKHHNALSDAVACAKVAIRQFEQTKSINVFFPSDLFPPVKESSGRGGYPFRSTREADMYGISFAVELLQNEYSFEGKTVIVTGTFDNFPDRDDLLKLLENKGARIVSSVTSKLDVMIIGKDPGWSKVEKVKALIAQGKVIELINEDQIGPKFKLTAQ